MAAMLAKTMNVTSADILRIGYMDKALLWGGRLCMPDLEPSVTSKARLLLSVGSSLSPDC